MASLGVFHSDAERVVLGIAPQFHLVILSTPDSRAVTDRSPRTRTPIKPVFFVQDIARARASASELGGEVKPVTDQWKLEDFIVCDGVDPEGNIFQLRQKEQTSSFHFWYSRPVVFVADIERAIRFYVDELGFEKKWHSGDGAGTVCQVNRSDCEIILCSAERTDKSRLFIELTPEGRDELEREVQARSIPNRETWWGYDTLVIDDPDGNELFFPKPD